MVVRFNEFQWQFWLVTQGSMCQKNAFFGDYISNYKLHLQCPLLGALDALSITLSSWHVTSEKTNNTEHFAKQRTSMRLLLGETKYLSLAADKWWRKIPIDF